MNWIDDKGRFIDDFAIRSDLLGQAGQPICLRLNLNATDVTVDNRYVDSACTVRQPQLVNNKRVRTFSGMPKQAPVGSSTNINVA